MAGGGGRDHRHRGEVDVASDSMGMVLAASPLAGVPMDVVVHNVDDVNGPGRSSGRALRVAIRTVLGTRRGQPQPHGIRLPAQYPSGISQPCAPGTPRRGDIPDL
eukprot:CAMPEP_0118924388 /NCGR_PEP_ID=MMETSP1169-20130426/2546_1 /TAXON_ID=36882 /ORGANISM="Pyramimonas obovata, Strain CCMP722" /LENGTH=104 /DNA_ID=CAMNT_0006865495 /DNA_START=773 /DNA_END=1087 /DNA_ORIENTATION=+